jgi:hypothetical protein
VGVPTWGGCFNIGFLITEDDMAAKKKATKKKATKKAAKKK